MICNLITKISTENNNLKYGISCKQDYTSVLIKQFNTNDCLKEIPCEPEESCSVTTTLTCSTTVSQASLTSCNTLTIVQT